MDKLIYLDYNATTPIDAEVAQEMHPFLDIYFGNPSSNHKYGLEAKIAVENARAQLAQLLNCKSEEIVFTSGGSESNNYAIKGVAFANSHKGKHIITSAVEHPAVIEVCRYLEKNGFDISYLPVDENGYLHPETLEKAFRHDTILVSVMHANNEVGVVEPIEKLAEITHNHGAIFHTDAAQSIGKINTDVQKLGVDLMSVAAHKFYGPKGIGALFIKTGITLEKLIHGANHERNHRAGTENILEIAGIGKAAEIACRDLDKNMIHYAKMRNLLEEKLSIGIADIRINSKNAERLPNTLSVSIPKIEANTLLDEIQGVAASAGAACHTDSIDISSVLEAMKLPLDYAMGTIRFSTGRGTTSEEIEEAAKIFIEKVNQIRGEDSDTINQITTDRIKLTHYTHGLGCACKLRPQDLEKVLKNLPKIFDKNVLVGAETSDDAAVYLIDENTAIVQTLDFFTPIVDDPYSFGAIAAANALSDIYAMGSKPLFALNIVGFPEKRLPLKVLEDILLGAADKASEAGISIIGGHTVEDTEPKFGMVVSGIINPKNILKNIGGHDGDKLVLTKPIGTGILSTASKRGLTSSITVDYIVKLMSTLNKSAAEIASDFNPSACTDVSGFGLLGHLREMVLNTDIGVQINMAAIPIIPETRQFAMANIIPGGTINNMNWVEKDINYDSSISKIDKIILNDAQTSGGLLLAIPKENINAFMKVASSKNEQFYQIGEFSSALAGKIKVER
ncbi:MAG: selenide, water dikinase SelD [Bacteroidetes bacterium CG2_30_33_31]|nr:MAG: selenide, water dikinase SelD [Bacteroidetes bacterium CG2_30_33_31]